MDVKTLSQRRQNTNPTPKPTPYKNLSAISTILLKLCMRCEGETGEMNSPEHRTCILPSPGNLQSPNYQGHKSELCVLGIKKRLMYFQDTAGLTAVNKVSRLTRLTASSCSFLTETVVLTGLPN